MSEVATFSSVLVKACRAKREPTASDIAIRDGNGLPGEPLAIFGSGDRMLTLSSAGLRFKEPEGTAVNYSWDDLDFILPGDLSLANDKLHTFSNMDVLAGQIARTIGYVFAIAAIAGLVFLVVSTIYGIFAPAVSWLHENLGTFGDILSFIGICALCMLLAPFAIPIALGALAAGGIVGVLANAIGRQCKPLVRWGLLQKFGDFPNGLYVIKSKWVKLPWGTPTTQLLDLIMVGVKLRRRGLS